jgi:hypothetical protein
MKLFASMSVICLVLGTASCAKKSDSTAGAGDHADAAVSVDDPAACAAMQEVALHGAPEEGFTASEGSKFQVKVEWSSPLVSGELNNSAKVTFLSHHGEPLALTLASFKLFMPAMGHGTIKADKLVFKQDTSSKNVWDVSQIYFSMGGGANEWVVDVEGSACGVSDKARVLIPAEVQ